MGVSVARGEGRRANRNKFPASPVVLRLSLRTEKREIREDGPHNAPQDGAEFTGAGSLAALRSLPPTQEASPLARLSLIWGWHRPLSSPNLSVRRGCHLLSERIPSPPPAPPSRRRLCQAPKLPSPSFWNPGALATKCHRPPPDPSPPQPNGASSRPSQFDATPKRLCQATPASPTGSPLSPGCRPH